MSVIARFWRKVQIGAPDACWLWLGCRTNGYGQFSISTGRASWAHRYAWMAANGPIPPGMLVCHRCDNPPCVNPAHLFLGTHADNMADCVQKGRQFRGLAKSRLMRKVALHGEENPASRLSLPDVLEIRHLLKQGITQRVLAARYGVGQRTICDINLRATWA